MREIRVVVLGAGGSYPPPGYAGPCILLEAGGGLLLVEAGEACVARLGQAGVDPCGVDRVYVSHQHIDHWAGLHSLAVARTAHGCRGGMIVHLPWLGDSPAPEGLAVLEERGHAVLSERAPVIEGYRVEPVPVEHSVPTYGLRVMRGGETLLFYTADTMYAPRIAGEARGARLLLAEATLPSGVDPQVGGMHMRVGDAVRLAREAGAGVLALVHLSPGGLEDARRIEPPPGLVVVYGEGYGLLV